MSELRHYDTIIAPVITEKTTLASEHGKVVFEVAKGATKPQIKKAVEAIVTLEEGHSIDVTTGL
jgi:large subunit ribosomal protein L23